MTAIKKTIGRLPQNLGDYDSTKVYGKKNRVFLYGCEWQSQIEGNTYAPATLNAQAGTITPDTTHWKLVTGDYNLWLFQNGYNNLFPVPADVSQLSIDSTFRANELVAINGVIYRATQNTSNLPVLPVIEEDPETGEDVLVIDNVNGFDVLVVADYTLQTGWEVWLDLGVRHMISWIENKRITV